VDLRHLRERPTGKILAASSGKVLIARFTPFGPPAVPTPEIAAKLTTRETGVLRLIARTWPVTADQREPGTARN